MVDDIEISNQQVLVEDLRSQMPIWEPPDEPKPLYIATSRYYNRTGPGEWSDGIEVVPLDERTVAWRTTGDWRDNGDWLVSSLAAFREFVVEDADKTFMHWVEQRDDHASEWENIR